MLLFFCLFTFAINLWHRKFVTTDVADQARMVAMVCSKPNTFFENAVVGLRTTFAHHCVSKKFPPLNSLQLCQILTNFQNFCTAGKRMKFATKAPHLRHVATLPREIKNSNFLQIFSRHCRSANILHINHL